MLHLEDLSRLHDDFDGFNEVVVGRRGNRIAAFHSYIFYNYREAHLNNVPLFLECVAPRRQVMIDLHEIKPTA